MWRACSGRGALKPRLAEHLFEVLDAVLAPEEVTSEGEHRNDAIAPLAYRESVLPRANSAGNHASGPRSTPLG